MYQQMLRRSAQYRLTIRAVRNRQTALFIRANSTTTTLKDVNDASLNATSSPQSRLEQLQHQVKVDSFSPLLTDTFGRQHNYLRISLTERCNLRCLYCMPEEGVSLSPPAQNLTTSEIVYLSKLFVQEGITKIRLTGGEPTVRKDIVELMKQIGQLAGLRELCLTTNAVALYHKLDRMVEAGLTGINISLDSQDPYQYALMTRSTPQTLAKVTKTIDRILQMNQAGAKIKLKINCVIIQGLNDRELIPFVEMTRHQDVEVRFIEYMPFDGNKWSSRKLFSYADMLGRIRQTYCVEKVKDGHNETSKTFRVPGFRGRLGFITSMTHNFCGSCNRLRVTCDGNLKVCLFGNDEVSLRDLLRQHNNRKPLDDNAVQRLSEEVPSRLLNLVGRAVKRKAKEHAGLGELEEMKNRPMILIGG